MLSYFRTVIAQHKSILLIPALMMLALFASAQIPGTVDPTFGSAGAVVHDVDDFDMPIDMFINSADQIFVLSQTGHNTIDGFDMDYTISSFSSAGNAIGSFGSSGSLTGDFTGFTYTDPVAIAQQSDGKIVLLGEGRAMTEQNGFFCVRQYSNLGVLDQSFGTNGEVSFELLGGGEEPRAMALQADGKILVGGASFDTTLQHIEYPVICRLNADGSFDQSFGVTGKLALDFGDGMIDLSMLQLEGTERHLDGGFLNHIAVLSNGTIQCAGSYFDGFNYICMVFRLLSDGALDLSFGSGGVLVTSLSPGFKNRLIEGVLLPNDRTLYLVSIAGIPGDSELNLIELSAGGGLGSLQTWDVHSMYDAATSVTMPANGRPVVVGRAISPANISEGYLSERFGVARLKEQAGDFVLDQWFLNSGVDTIAAYGGFRCGAEVIKTQSDGRLVIAGFSEPNDTVNTRNTVLIRIDGSIADAVENNTNQTLQLEVWPNPSNDFLHFDSPFANSATRYTVLDATGRIVLESSVSKANEINIANLPAGLYNLLLCSDDKRATAIFVKH
jgi:uncharacterized delta-60 repeat protein